MKKFFKRSTEERGRKKKEELSLQNEQDILHGRKALAGSTTRNTTNELSLLDPRGMMKRKNLSRSIIMDADVVVMPPSDGTKHFMADYTISPNNSSSPSNDNDQQQQQGRRYSAVNNPLSATYRNNIPPSLSTNSNAVMRTGSNTTYNHNSGGGGVNNFSTTSMREDKLIKQRLNEQRVQYYKTISEGSSSADGHYHHPIIDTVRPSRDASGDASVISDITCSIAGEPSVGSGGSSKESLDKQRLTKEEQDKRTKELIKQQRLAASTSGGYRSTPSSSADSGNFEELIQPRRRITQEEQDKRTKELIKQQRLAASSSGGGYRSTSSSVDSGNFEDLIQPQPRKRLSQEEQDKRTKEIIKQQRAAASSSLGASCHSITSSYGDDEGSFSRSWRSSVDDSDDSSNHQLPPSLRELSRSLREERAVRDGNNARSSSGSGDSKREGGAGLRSAMKGNHRYSVHDGHGSGASRKNQDGDEEWKMVSFAGNEDEGEGRESRRASSIKLSEDDDEEKNKAMPKEGDFDNSEINIDDYNEAILASAREFGGPDYHDKDDELRRSNLIDLHVAQFLATSQISTNDDFDPSELKEIYHQSLEGVEEEDEDHTASPTSQRRLSHFVKKEAEQNMKRRMSQRLSKTSLRLAAWHQKQSLRMALKVANRTPEMDWLSSFYRSDPRWQIQAFFDEVAREGGDAQMSEDFAASPLALLFNKANVFTVWRPTSDEAIKNMMLGIATGKGLDIKGKSAKRGNISSYVPFIQIYEEQHKEHVREFLKDGRTIRVFYQSEASRNEALEMLMDIKDFMLFAAQDAMRILSDERASEEEQELAMKHLMYDDTNIRVTLVDTYVKSDNPVFGLDITERLFWESYVMMQDCSRSAGTQWDIGRKSEPTFMDFNFKSLRKEPAPGAPRAVVYQFAKDSPMEPRMLLMAYEEHGMVKPVVSDFDCFLLGSRGVKYSQKIPPDQVELVKWSVKNISEVLDKRAESKSDSGWMAEWFQVLKKAAMRNYVPITPKYGNGDPKSYEIIEIAVSRLKGTGCVRHGAECFNWYFPQEIDDEFLVISDTLPGKVKWMKMNVFELQEILMTKIDEGFTFPINPKWVLCDPGWRRVYDKLLASKKPNVQDSLNCWLPPETGLREKIDAISKRHPHGFEGRVYKVEGTEVMDKMEEELERYRRVQGLWRKVRGLVWWIIFLRTKSQTIRLEAIQQRR